MSFNQNPAKRHDHKKILYKILPSIYRERDKTADLKRFLNASGTLLDQIQATLLQRYADIFPDNDAAFERVSQTWLLPYIADLLDVDLVSPLEQGQRSEIANAISWRKAKGTVNIVEQIAESVGGLEVVVHEGWKRVATTARIGMPVLPLDNYGYTGNESWQTNYNHFQQTGSPDLAPMWARHPALPAGTVDLRCQASAVAAEPDNPAAKTSYVSRKKYRWRQSNLHGAQNCNEGRSILPMDGRQADWIPGYFDDPSVRLVDFRNSGWRQGHFHPRSVLLFAATHPGFFGPVPAQRIFEWNDELPGDENFLHTTSVNKIGQKIIFRNKSLDQKRFQPIIIHKDVKLGQTPSGTGPVEPWKWQFDGFVFTGTVEVDSGRLELNRCSALGAEVHGIDSEKNVLTANNCLFKRVHVARGLINIQYCTVLTTTIAEKLNTSDSIFNGLIRKDLDETSLPGSGCLRYSSVSPDQDPGLLTLFQTRFLAPVFYTADYGRPGCGVLHPATDESIVSGAQDGGEMGAYHHLYIARPNAVKAKLKRFLPTGMKPVVIPDESLHDLPGEVETG